MRFVPTYCLREGMLLGDNLYNQNGDLMLSAGTVLTEEYVSAIERLKYNGIYIEDDISKDLAILNVVSDKVRSQTIKGIKSVFVDLEKGNSVEKHRSSFLAMKAQIEQIVDEICNNREAMINMVDMKVFDDYTYFHSVNVAVISVVLGAALDMDREELCNLGYAALLHDIGKVFVDRKILNKAGRLTNEEFSIIREHSQRGGDYIRKGFGLSQSAYVGIMDHHEKYGGGGYPNNLRGNNISWYGRIISVADVYDALTSDRPYRKGMLPAEAMEYVMAGSSTMFDPKVVEVFVRKIAPYPVGTCVKLSNGLVGIVIENSESFCMRPRIRIFKENGEFLEQPYILDLSSNDTLNVTVMAIV